MGGESDGEERLKGGEEDEEERRRKEKVRLDDLWASFKQDTARKQTDLKGKVMSVVCLTINPLPAPLHHMFAEHP